MKKTIAILSIFFFFGHFAQAQFKKPLQSASSKVNSSEALYNIGLIGGLNSTYWLHSGGTQTKYNYPFNFGISGGLAIERMLNKSTSVSLEGYYAMRKVNLNYEVLNFPTHFPRPDDDGNRDFYRQLDVDFQEVNVQTLYTYYLSTSNIRPYIFIGPRVSVPLRGNLHWQKIMIEGYGTASQHLNDHPDIDTIVGMNEQNTWDCNIGLVAGAGVMFKLNVGNYYFLIKADVSAHAALAYLSFTNEVPFLHHASLLNSFTYDEKNNEDLHVVGAGYIDPYLLGTRINTDATAKITLMFPLKKQLQGACIRWGEYD